MTIFTRGGVMLWPFSHFRLSCTLDSFMLLNQISTLGSFRGILLIAVMLGISVLPSMSLGNLA